jgi:hypothetical protein
MTSPTKPVVADYANFNSTVNCLHTVFAIRLQLRRTADFSPRKLRRYAAKRFFRRDALLDEAFGFFAAEDSKESRVDKKVEQRAADESTNDDRCDRVQNLCARLVASDDQRHNADVFDLAMPIVV